MVVCFGCQKDEGTAVPLPVADSLNIQTAQEGNLTLYKIGKYNITIVKIPRISSYLYVNYPTRSFEQIGRDSGFTVVITADFCEDYEIGKGFIHAGFLKIHDSIYTPYKVDKQLNRYFAYNTRTNTVQYFGLDEFSGTASYDLVMQTGPQIVLNDVIDTASINASINGNFPHVRTAFASVNGTELYVIAGINSVTLGELGRELLTSGIFGKGLSVINFDGGPSTILYVKNHPEYSYNQTRTMPLSLGVR
jgi:hypothetical protein